MHVDLNCDLGESFGRYQIGNDEQILPLISSANVACGFHASDPFVMRQTVARAKEAGVRVGAHPGYPDLQGFGRRPMGLTPDEAYCDMLYQLGALDAFLRSRGMQMQHVKPHGALYNRAAVDEDLAAALCRAIRDYNDNLIVLALSGGKLYDAAKKAGLRAAAEVFADRAYEEDGTLVNRKKPGAMITDEDLAIQRVVRMVREHKVQSITGKDIDLDADSICVHGDGLKALLFVQRIRDAFKEEGIEIKPLSDFITLA